MEPSVSMKGKKTEIILDQDEASESDSSDGEVMSDSDSYHHEKDSEIYDSDSEAELGSAS